MFERLKRAALKKQTFSGRAAVFPELPPLFACRLCVLLVCFLSPFCSFSSPEPSNSLESCIQIPFFFVSALAASGVCAYSVVLFRRRRPFIHSCLKWKMQISAADTHLWHVSRSLCLFVHVHSLGKGAWWWWGRGKGGSPWEQNRWM